MSAGVAGASSGVLPRRDPLAARAALLLWFVAGALLLTGLGNPPVRRTQEARVLVTAREMLISPDGWRAWLAPHMNGRIRLEKPPLAYWLSAASMKLFGVNDSAGRLPGAIAGWLTLACTFLIARRLWDDRAALLSAAVLGTGYMFFRHSRLAETDVLAGLFVTAAVYFFWRFVDEEPPARRWPLAHAAGVMLALAILAKGPPAAFAVLFFIVYALVVRRPRRLLSWCVSGAPLTLAVIALPWFIYVRALPEWPVVREELRVALAGEAHRGPFYEYFPQVLRATAPWCALMIAGLVFAIARWNAEPRMRGVLLWAGAIFVPLCLAGQKQPHYLVPLLPPLAVITGWLIWLCTSGGEDEQGSRAASDAALVRGVLLITCAAMVLAAIAVPIVGKKVRGELMTVDWILLAALLLAGTVGLLSTCRRGVGSGTLALAVPSGIMLAVLVGWWEPSLVAQTPRTIAARLRSTFGPSASYWFYGENQSLPLAWSLRSVVRQAQTPEQLEAAASREPSLVAIAQHKNNLTPPPPPPGFEDAIPPIIAEDQTFHFYVHHPPP